MKQRTDFIAGIFTSELGSSMAEGILEHDWSGVASSLAQSIGGAVQNAMSGLGAFGGFFGGLAGGLVTGLLGKVFGGLFGGKKSRGETQSNPIYTYDVNNERLLTELVNATKVQMLRLAAMGGRGQGDAAAAFGREAELIGALGEVA